MSKYSIRNFDPMLSDDPEVRAKYEASRRDIPRSRKTKRSAKRKKTVPYKIERKPLREHNDRYGIQKRRQAIPFPTKVPDERGGRGWTDEQIDFVIAAVDAGIPASKIAKAVGKTRSSVLGKVFRLRNEGQL